MVLKNEYAVVVIITALLFGAGCGYFYGQSPIAELREEVILQYDIIFNLTGAASALLEEYTTLQDQLTEAKKDLSTTQSILDDSQANFTALESELENFRVLHNQMVGNNTIKISELEEEYEELQLLYSVLEQEYNSLELSYEDVKGDYEKLRACIPPRVGIPYSELKKDAEGYSRNELIGVCGQDYLIPAPVNADIWEVNIMVISELSWQPVHITIYTVYEDYPPDWLGQPFAPYARGDGEVSISLTLNTSYAYVLRVRDAYAKPFTGFIEEHWSLEEEIDEGAYVWVSPIDATASGYTIWGGTWYTGPPSLAIDGIDFTSWTLNGMGEITFDLGSEKVVRGIEMYRGGHVTNGNTVNVYVDEKQVLSNEQFSYSSNIRYFTPVRGRFVKYQTVALPHNKYLQIASWSEISVFKVFVEED